MFTSLYTNILKAKLHTKTLMTYVAVFSALLLSVRSVGGVLPPVIPSETPVSQCLSRKFEEIAGHTACLPPSNHLLTKGNDIFMEPLKV